MMSLRDLVKSTPTGWSCPVPCSAPDESDSDASDASVASVQGGLVRLRDGDCESDGSARLAEDEEPVSLVEAVEVVQKLLMDTGCGKDLVSHRHARAWVAFWFRSLRRLSTRRKAPRTQIKRCQCRPPSWRTNRHARPF